LTQETGSNRSAPAPPQTGTNPSAPVRDDEPVEVLKQQLVHEREARKATEERNGELIGRYHEIAMASTQFGVELGKGRQEQGKARQLGVDGEPGSNRAPGVAPGVRTFSQTTQENPHAPWTDTTAESDHDGDNSGPGNGTLEVQ
jgi:hypothetical protein